MSEAYARLEPSLIPILRPLCMMLTNIEPGCNGTDLRIFECSKCGHVYRTPAEDTIKAAR